MAEAVRTGAPDVAEIRDWMVRLIATHLRAAPDDIDPDATFASYGIDSFEATVFSGDLERWLERELPATLLLEHPTISVLAAHLTGAGAEGEP